MAIPWTTGKIVKHLFCYKSLLENYESLFYKNTKALWASHNIFFSLFKHNETQLNIK